MPKQSGILQLACCFDGEQTCGYARRPPTKPRADTGGKRDLRFTGDSDDMHVLVPLSNNTFACRPDECPVVLTNHSTEDDIIILECARLLDMLEPMRDHSDRLLPSAYWNTCSALRQFAAFTDCDPKPTIAQSYGVCRVSPACMGNSTRMEAYAQHA